MNDLILTPHLLLYMTILGAKEFGAAMKTMADEDVARIFLFYENNTDVYKKDMENQYFIYNYNKQHKENTQYFHFCDTIVVSIRDLSYGSLVKLLRIANFIQEHFLKNDVLVKGAIHYGKLYHKENNIFGPSLIEARALSLESGPYPRIVVSEEVFNPDVISRIVFGGLSEKEVKTVIDDYLVYDNTVYYVDYINKFLGNVDENSIVNGDMLAWLFMHYACIARALSHHYDSSDTLMTEEYAWILKQYNASFQRLMEYDWWAEAFEALPGAHLLRSFHKRTDLSLVPMND